MAHHSSDQPFSQDDEQHDFAKRIIEQFNNRNAGLEMSPSAALKKMSESFGATGEYPKGKIAPHDEGAIRFGVAAHEGKVIIEFGTRVHFLGMDPEHAEAFAQSLLDKAREAMGQ